MARSIAAIKLSMTQRFIQEPAIIDLYNLDTNKSFEQQFSKVSFESILFDVISYCAFVLETLFDLHQVEVKNMVDEIRGPYLPWYVSASLNFQYGFELAPNEIFYDNTGIPQELVDNSKVVKYAAATAIFRGVRIKVAAENGGNLEPLSPEHFEAFKAYWSRIVPPGLIQLKFNNQEADKLKLHLTCYYNPLVLDADGKRRDGTNDKPLTEAIEDFCKNQVFNGTFVPLKLVDAMQAVEGVEIPIIELLQVSYADTDWLEVPVSYVPDAGYLRLYELDVNYIPNTSI